MVESKDFPRFSANDFECSWLLALDDEKSVTIVIDVFMIRAGNEATLTFENYSNGEILVQLDETITQPKRISFESTVRKCTLKYIFTVANFRKKIMILLDLFFDPFVIPYSLSDCYILRFFANFRKNTHKNSTTIFPDCYIF